ncbi:hypothetical protein ACIP5N_21585 [Streptomyces sp. NPDC088768]|uniref:hypothetical protein n=1 Tax=Streptomyces sp. NPDC088768 TaxID=3365894 RepID=UPI003803856B
MQSHHEDTAKPASRRPVTRPALLLASATAALALGITAPAHADSHIISAPAVAGDSHILTLPQAGDSHITSAPAQADIANPGASAAGWDYVGVFGFKTNGKFSISDWGRSHGTNFRACIVTKSTGAYNYDLWEYDAGGVNDFARTWIASPGSKSACHDFNNITAFVDGSDGTAEFYIKTNDPNAKAVRFYD